MLAVVSAAWAARGETVAAVEERRCVAVVAGGRINATPACSEGGWVGLEKELNRRGAAGNSLDVARCAGCRRARRRRRREGGGRREAAVGLRWARNRSMMGRGSEARIAECRREERKGICERKGKGGEGGGWESRPGSVREWPGGRARWHCAAGTVGQPPAKGGPHVSGGGAGGLTGAAVPTPGGGGAEGTGCQLLSQVRRPRLNLLHTRQR